MARFLSRAQLRRGQKKVLHLVGSDVEVSAGDVTQFTHYLGDLIERFENLEELWKLYGDYLVKQNIPRRFKQQGAPLRWAKLSDRYAAIKRRKYGRKPILVATGAMRAGFKYQATKRTLRIVNTVKRPGGAPYWVYHQLGAPKINLPTRPVLQLTRFDYSKLRKLAEAHLRRAQTRLSGAGL
ncbi:MAG TPA: phage virion morphogenesis protein [Anaerolineae bacterium]|nr:phage virion morphogenesis protein [Anaerolineae bacterium]